VPRIYNFLFFCFGLAFSFAQNVFPPKYFSPPLAGKLSVSGTFGELRPDHFHTGIDFSTQNKVNTEVLSIAAGYVSRIKISATGYGKVIYITHPNGFVSVYAHLGAFNVVVDDYVKKKQYEKETFEIELFPNPALFPVKKGDIIGYSGNSGSSSGPHLHFEIRSELSEHPVNPLFSGMFPPDTEKPFFETLVLYPSGGNSLVNGQGVPVIIDLKKTRKDNSVNVTDTFRVQGPVAFGMEAYDRSIEQGDYGIYSGEIWVDSVPFFKVSFDSLSFDEGRYVNTLKDYSEYYNHGKNIIQTHVTPGNRLKLYPLLTHNGRYYFCDTNYHTITFMAKDFYGNFARQNLTVKSQTHFPMAVSSERNNSPLYRYGLKWHFEARNISIDLPSDALYDSIYFDYQLLRGTGRMFSDVHHIHDASVPLHSFVLLKIKPDTLFASIDRSKLTIARLVRNSFVYVKSEWDGGSLSAKIRSFGNYFIVSDTVPPEIRVVGKIKNRKILPGDMIRFTINDEFSGIDTYHLTINGKWVLAEYDAKNDMIIYTAEAAHFTKGSNTLVLAITDKLNNRKVFRTTVLF
jgi:murein DD-endopeptidase MepM/ murein hydrolase activator NlpD